MTNILEEYKLWLIAQGQSENTIDSYLTGVRNLLEEIELEKLSEKNIISYLLKLKEDKAPATVKLRRNNIISFLKFLKKDIEIPAMVKTKYMNKLPEHFSEKEFKEKILPLIPDLFRYPLRVEAIFNFMFYTGVRRHELSTLKRKNIDFEKRVVKVKGKGNKERLIGIHKKIIPLLKMYFSSEEEDISAFNCSDESIGNYCDSISKYFERFKITPHTFRHSFAMWFINKTGNPIALQRLLGHENIATTMIYTRMTDKEIIDQYRKAEEE